MKTNLHFTFKHAKPNNKTLIHNWLDQAYIREWLHGIGLENTLESLDQFLKGTSSFQHWIAYDKNIPFAYLLTSQEGSDGITLDLFICDTNYLGKGLSVTMIREFLLSQFPNIKTVYIDPEKSNTRAVHVYQKVGFKIIDEFIASWHPVPHYKMKLEMKDL